MLGRSSGVRRCQQLPVSDIFPVGWKCSSPAPELQPPSPENVLDVDLSVLLVHGSAWHFLSREVGHMVARASIQRTRVWSSVLTRVLAGSLLGVVPWTSRC